MASNLEMKMYKNIKNKNFILFFIILVSVIIAYFPSFSVPFYFDDYLHIKDNPLLLEGDLSQIFKQQRAIGVFSFWLNFKLNLSSLFELHLTNLIIHLINCSLVFTFIKLLFRTPALNNTNIKISPIHFAYLGALIFALHPLNTQAVTYIVQRFASLVLMFYLATVIFYIFARNSKSLSKRVGYFILAFISLILAINTKQNAVTLLLIFFVIELTLYKSLNLRSSIWLLLTFLIFTAALFILKPEYLVFLDNLTTETNRYTRLEYFYTQLTVILVYISKFFIPTPLLLENDLSPNSYSSLITFISFCTIVATLTFGWKIRQRSPLVLFGLLFYLSAISIESSFIPIKDMMVEHRTYIPNVGLIISVIGFLFTTTIPLRAVTTSLTVVCIIFGFITFQRNTLWQDPIKFHEHEFKHNPDHARVSGNLAKAYLEAGQLENGIEQLDKTLALTDGEIDDELAINLVAASIEAEEFDRAEKLAAVVIPNLKSSRVKATLLNNLGVLYLRLNKFDKAENYLIKSLQEKQYLPQSHYAIGVVYFNQKKYGKAYGHIERLLQLQPSHKDGKRLRNLLINIYRNSRKNAKNNIHDGR